MAKERKAYAPFSLTSEAGVAQTPVEGYIDVRQEIYPTVNTGSINENGKWTGDKRDDKQFIGISKPLAIPNSGNVVFPDTNNHPNIVMNGFRTLQFALKTTRAGTYAVMAVFGPDTERFANLEPIASGEGIRIINDSSISDENILNDNVNLDSANAWFIFTILADRTAGQENMQIKVTNSAGGDADIEFAFRRLI